MDRLFGKRFLSARRIIVLVAAAMVVRGILGSFPWRVFSDAFSEAVSSFSITRIVSNLVAHLLGTTPYLSLFSFVFLYYFSMRCIFSIHLLWLMHERPADPDLVYKTRTQV
jgi:hypothetical protein